MTQANTERQSILDVTNFALSLDLNGKMFVRDSENRHVEIFFANRKLQDVVIEGEHGWSALKSLLRGVWIGDDFVFEHDFDETSGPLDLDYDSLLDFVMINEDLDEEEAQLALRNCNQDLHYVPLIPPDLLPKDENLIACGILNRHRVRLRIFHIQDLPPSEKLEKILYSVRDQSFSLSDLQHLFYTSEILGKNTETELIELFGYTICIIFGENSPFIGFTVTKANANLSQDRISNNLDLIWDFLSLDFQLSQLC